MEYPLVSIIIPTYNRADLILETLQSVQNQTYTNWECIIVDDGSKDRTEEVVRDFIKTDSRYQYYKRPEHHKPGGNGARNFGFSLAKGDYINWFDSDDIMIDNHLSNHVLNIQNFNIDISVSKGLIFENDKLNIKGEWSIINSEDDLVDDMISNKVLWPINNVVWNKKILDVNSLFDENLYCSQEWVFHLHYVLEGGVYKSIDIATTLIRRHDSRIGKLQTENKVQSIFLSRKIIFEKLCEKRMVNKHNSIHILKFMNQSLRSSILKGFSSTEKNIISYFFKNGQKFQSKNYFYKTLFIAYPIFKIFKKGEKLFKL